MVKPILSIVIANYNFGRFLEDAIKSIVSQNVGDQVEIIICDAASTDNSVEIIKKYAEHITWWCSEPDKGQSDAFNKGIAHSRGKYLTWLNADDIFVPGCLTKVLAQMTKHPDCEWFTGNLLRFENDSRKICEVDWGPHFLPDFLQTKSSPVCTYGPATFFSRKIFDQYGPFDLRLHYSMDTDLWQKFVFGGVKKRRINAFCWGFRMHDESKTAEWTSDKDEQGKRDDLIRLENCPYKMSKFWWLCVKLWQIVDGSVAVQVLAKLSLTGRKIDSI